jgi:hypothetical protein
MILSVDGLCRDGMSWVKLSHFTMSKSMLNITLFHYSITKSGCIWQGNNALAWKSHDCLTHLLTFGTHAWGILRLPCLFFCLSACSSFSTTRGIIISKQRINKLRVTLSRHFSFSEVIPSFSYCDWLWLSCSDVFSMLRGLLNTNGAPLLRSKCS